VQQSPAQYPQENRHGLTQRQIQVLDLISVGKSNKAIGDALGLTSGTIKMHISRIFKILDVENRTEAAAKFADLKKHL
jgi:DNA-binding NarL/FixJ family response regulator